MEDISPGTAEPCLEEALNSAESQRSCEEEKSVAGSNSDADESEKEAVVHTRTLLSRIDDFRQSYNRTHGQVCEFFERARVVQRLGLLDPSQAAQLALSGDEADEEDCNSLADCNCADGQKTTGMKRKLRKWRKAMRSALLEICPNLGVDNQPDINPGLMKYILEEVRQLKSQVACQHNSILQLARKSELYRVDGERKEQFISDLLQNCKGIRLDSAGPNRSKDGMGQGPTSFMESTSNEPNVPLPESIDDIQFGQSKEIINSLKLDMAHLGGADVEQLVVEPMDFAAYQQQLQLQNRQSGSSSRDAEGSSSAPSFLPAITGLHQQGVRERNVQAHQTCPAENSVGVPSVHGTTSAGMSSRPDSATPPNRRYMLMNLSGLTAAVVGGLVLTSVQRKKQ